MTTYNCEYEYLKATEESPCCVIEGETVVVANSKDEARQALCTMAKMRSIEGIAIIKMTEAAAT